MRLQGANGTIVELTLAEREFAGDTHHWYDQWIIVEGRVVSPQGDWQFRDACLLVQEAQELARWLEGVTTGATPIEDPLDFLEPNLAFVLIGGSDRVALRVVFELEARPPWARSETAYGPWSIDREELEPGEDYWSLHDTWVEVDEVTPDDLRAAAAELRAELASLGYAGMPLEERPPDSKS